MINNKATKDAYDKATDSKWREETMNKAKDLGSKAYSGAKNISTEALEGTKKAYKDTKEWGVFLSVFWVILLGKSI